MSIGKGRWCIFATVLLACLALGLMLGGRPEPSLPLGLMDRPFQLPLQRRSLFDRLVPTTPSWAWLWRLKDAVLGPRRAVNIEASAFAFAHWSDTALTNLALGPPDFLSTNGVRLWVRSDAELKRLRAQIMRSPYNELLASPRVSTGDGTEACMFIGSMIVANGCTNQVGLTLDLCPRVRREAMDLTTIITLSETVPNPPTTEVGTAAVPVPLVRTNLEAGARLRLPKGTGMFLLGAGSEKPGPRPVGVILTAAVLKRP